MTRWAVRLEFEGIRGGESASDRVDILLDLLHAHDAVISHNEESLAVFLAIEAAAPDVAFREARRIVLHAFGRAGLARGHLCSIETQPMDALRRQVEIPNFPDLVGIAEAAEILGVSKQRASELARSRRFPPPIIRLASGPIWLEDVVTTFARDWERKPGRPRKTAAG